MVSSSPKILFINSNVFMANNLIFRCFSILLPIQSNRVTVEITGVTRLEWCDPIVMCDVKMCMYYLEDWCDSARLV